MKKITLLAFVLLSGATLTVSAQTEPQVTTNPLFARGSTVAFGRATFKATGSNAIKERGFCWSSTNRVPTIEDSHSKLFLTNNGPIFKMTDLQPATVYYARPYAIGKDDAVGYGEVLKIVTLPQGNVTWTYDYSGDAGQNERISNATAECVEYWNRYTSIDGINLSVHYSAGTPTADCSYGGWMRVGPQVGNQKTGTIMHEALHGIGVGTHSVWNGSSSPLRAGSGTGAWLGDRANQVLQFWDNDPNAQLKGDGTHMWPYGVNGAHEDTGTEVLYTGLSLIAQALGEDGLPPTGLQGCGQPYYALNQEDTIKYYLKNEAEACGLLTSYLVETDDHQLKWQAMTAAEAVANDASAWYVTFTPSNQYYQVRNAKTGRYITYNNGFTTAVRNTPSAADNLQLKRSRIEPKTAAGTVVSTERAFWVLRAENNNATPATLTASANGAVTSTGFDLKNTATKQRWLFLTADQASEMENQGLSAARVSFNALHAQLNGLTSVPHAEVIEGADDTYASALTMLNSQAAAAHSIEELTSLNAALLAAAKVFLASVCVTDFTQPFDLTFMMTNPAFDGSADGWSCSAGSTYNYQSVEFYQKLANVSQTLKEMPLGTYRLNAQAFQRPGSYTDVYNDYIAGTDGVGGRLYISSASKGFVFIKNLMADRSATRLHTDDKQMPDGTFVPNTMASAHAYFEAGLYDNEVEYFFPAAGDLKLGLLASNNTGTSFWAIFSNFRLAYYGPLTKEEIEERTNAIIEIEDTPAETPVYDLSGRCVGTRLETLPQGLYIVNGKKVAK